MESSIDARNNADKKTDFPARRSPLSMNPQ
jgi:hypothetical protein